MGHGVEVSGSWATLSSVVGVGPNFKASIRRHCYDGPVPHATTPCLFHTTLSYLGKVPTLPKSPRKVR